MNSTRLHSEDKPVYTYYIVTVVTPDGRKGYVGEYCRFTQDELTAIRYPTKHEAKGGLTAFRAWGCGRYLDGKNCILNIRKMRGRDKFGHLIENMKAV